MTTQMLSAADQAYCPTPVDKFAFAGWAVIRHDDDLVPPGASSAERGEIVRRYAIAKGMRGFDLGAELGGPT